jgi:hypothetical protein
VLGEGYRDRRRRYRGRCEQGTETIEGGYKRLEEERKGKVLYDEAARTNWTSVLGTVGICFGITTFVTHIYILLHTVA